jgi:hypothetical protein
MCSRRVSSILLWLSPWRLWTKSITVGIGPSHFGRVVQRSKRKPVARAAGLADRLVSQFDQGRVEGPRRDRPEPLPLDRHVPLRRAFGVRWAARQMPAQLMELMRHESIDTTLRYYVGTDAQRTAEAAWAAYEQAALAVFSGPLPNSSPNSGPSGPPAAEPPLVRKCLPGQALPPNGAAGTRTQDQRIKSPDDPDG